ncbi:MAG TPA: flagellar protein FlgN [Peptococcaceae bacterium]|nr:flagellar protein FlgN [Peptococcaceae bacterium]
MSDIRANFQDNLKRLTACYRKLVGLEELKQQALVNNKISEIEVITAQEEKILFEVSRLEEERLHWADFFGQEIGKKAEEITLADLEEKYPELHTVREELEEEISCLKKWHETNTKLLENAVNLVNFTLQALTGDRQTTYTNPANKKEKAKTFNLIDKSI